jgi:hypothetical protein
VNQIGVVIRDGGAAIVTVTRKPADDVVVDIERLPFDVDVVAARVGTAAAASKDSRVIVDAEGLGNALWAIVAPKPRGERWHLYSGRGLERQVLVDQLVVAMHDASVHFAPGLLAQEPMTKALLGYRRQVREDGLIGSELVIALCLAISKPPPKLGGWAFIA